MKKVKNGSKRWVKKSASKNNEDNSSTLFVFYTFHRNKDSERWIYNKFPYKWEWIGGCSTTAIGKKPYKNLYELEEQFSGPSKNINYNIIIYKIYLTNLYSKLVKYYDIFYIIF